MCVVSTIIFGQTDETRMPIENEASVDFQDFLRTPAHTHSWAILRIENRKQVGTGPTHLYDGNTGHECTIKTYSVTERHRCWDCMQERLIEHEEEVHTNSLCSKH